MVPLMSLWMPILLSAIVVFIASSIIHMVLGYHHSDYSRVPNEAAAQDGLRALNLTPGDRKSTRLNSSHIQKSRMPSSA